MGVPQIMGILNATPDSFSDGGRLRTVEDGLRRAQQLLAEGAELLDIGGETSLVEEPAVSPDEEIERVVPLIARVVSELGATVSVDTYKPAVAAAAVEAGAAIVNDISGLGDDELARLCARTGASLVILHTPVAPKSQTLDDDRVHDVRGWLVERMAHAVSLGMREEQIILDPGPDFGKTPAQTVQTLRELPALVAVGRPVLLAASRKGFIGAIVRRRARERGAATLATTAFGADVGVAMVRVHDVADTRDFLTMRAALRGELALDPALRLPGELLLDR